MKETYTIDQKFTYSEYLDMTYAQLYRMKIIKRLFLFLLVIGVISGFSNVMYSGKHDIAWYIVVVQILLGPLMAFLFFIVGPAILVFALMKLKPKLFAETTSTFTHWGMEKTGGSINYSAQWKKFLKYRETKKYLLLYISEAEVHVIQKRLFKDNTELDGFKQLLDEKIQRH